MTARRARLWVVERGWRVLAEPELAYVIEADVQAMRVGRAVRFNVMRKDDGALIARAGHDEIVHNGVACREATLRDGDRVGAGDEVLRIDIEGAGVLDDVVTIGAEVLGWRIPGDQTLLRALRVSRGYEVPLEALRLFASYRDDVARYDALGTLAAKRVGLAVSEVAADVESAFLVRHSTRGARAAAIVARPDGTIDDVVALWFARALIEAYEHTGEVVPLENLALTFEGEVVVAALAPRGRRLSLVTEIGRVGAATIGATKLALTVATSLVMMAQDGTSASAFDVVDDALRSLVGTAQPDVRALGALVQRLFRVEWSAEERWREEAALLDDDARRRLARG